MTNTRPASDVPFPATSSTPFWGSLSRSDSPEDLVFFSGAALAQLHPLLTSDDLYLPLLRERLALTAAAACLQHIGRSERAPELRDEVHLLRPGERPGPGGAVYQQWRAAVTRKLTIVQLHKCLPHLNVEDIAVWLDGNAHRRSETPTPIGRACSVLETVMDAMPDAEPDALILADAALAQNLKWGKIVPLFAQGLKTRDLRKRGSELRVACYKAVGLAAIDAVSLASDLSRRTTHMKSIAPKLRSKSAAAAVDIFLNRDALSPSVALTRIMSNRSARRLCDRLVALGAVRELTGRENFRLYGV